MVILQIIVTSKLDLILGDHCFTTSMIDQVFILDIDIGSRAVLFPICIRFCFGFLHAHLSHEFVFFHLELCLLLGSNVLLFAAVQGWSWSSFYVFGCLELVLLLLLLLKLKLDLALHLEVTFHLLKNSHGHLLQSRNLCFISLPLLHDAIQSTCHVFVLEVGTCNWARVLAVRVVIEVDAFVVHQVHILLFFIVVSIATTSTTMCSFCSILA